MCTNPIRLCYIRWGLILVDERYWTYFRLLSWRLEIRGRSYNFRTCAHSWCTHRQTQTSINAQTRTHAHNTYIVKFHTYWISMLGSLTFHDCIFKHTVSKFTGVVLTNRNQSRNSQVGFTTVLLLLKICSGQPISAVNCVNFIVILLCWRILYFQYVMYFTISLKSDCIWLTSSLTPSRTIIFLGSLPQHQFGDTKCGRITCHIVGAMTRVIICKISLRLH